MHPLDLVERRPGRLAALQKRRGAGRQEILDRHEPPGGLGMAGAGIVIEGRRMAVIEDVQEEPFELAHERTS